jgi:hypothetical protein
MMFEEDVVAISLVLEDVTAELEEVTLELEISLEEDTPFSSLEDDFSLVEELLELSFTSVLSDSTELLDLSNALEEDDSLFVILELLEISCSSEESKRLACSSLHSSR